MSQVPEMGRMSSSESRHAEVFVYNSGTLFDTYLVKAYSKDEAAILMFGRARQEGAGGFLKAEVRWLKEKDVYREITHA